MDAVSAARAIARLICLAGFSSAFLAVFLLRPPPHKADKFGKQVMAYFGRFVFLTVQTNFTGVLYFSAAFAASLTGSVPLHSFTVRMFPLMFALGTLLTPLYYAGDHFNPAKKVRNQELKEMGYRHVHIADHLEHAPALPLAFLEALVFPGTAPDSGWSILLTSVYIFFYLGITIINRNLTGVWTYPLFDDAQNAGGYLGVGGVVLVVAAFLSMLGLGGNLLVHLIHG